MKRRLASRFVLASRLFREIYDIALLNRREENRRGLKRTEGEKGEENNAKEMGKVRGGGRGRGRDGDGNGGEGIEGEETVRREEERGLAASEAMEIIFS